MANQLALSPVSEEIFNIYLGMYKYDKTELNSTIESIDDSAEDFSLEKISFDAAYGNECVTAYLFLPKNSKPPYQAIVFFPGGYALRAGSSSNLVSQGRHDFIVKSGRAFLYPVYKGTYERMDDPLIGYPNETNKYKEYVIQLAKDLGRSIDYLETRNDIDCSKLAYLGSS